MVYLKAKIFLKGAVNMANRSKRTLEKTGQFLELLQSTGNVSMAARAVGWGRRTAYDYRSSDGQFAVQWDDAIEVFMDSCEQELYRRAVSGYEEPVVYRGEIRRDDAGQPLTVRKFSDACLIFLLKGRRRDIYGDHLRNEHSGLNGGNVAMNSAVQIYVPDNGRDAVQQRLEQIPEKTRLEILDRLQREVTNTNRDSVSGEDSGRCEILPPAPYLPPER